MFDLAENKILSPKKKRSLWPKIIIAVLLCVGLGYGAQVLRLTLSSEKTDDAYIEGHVHLIGAGVAGTLVDVAVNDNALVKRGQVLAKIDPEEFEIMENKASAMLEQAKAGVLESHAKVAQAHAAESQADADIAVTQAQIKEGESRMKLAHSIMDRNVLLSNQNARAISQSGSDKVQSDFAAAQAVVEAANAKLTAARAGKQSSAAAIQAAEAAVVVAKAQIAAGQAAVSEAHRQRGLSIVTSPADGRVGNKNAEIGNRVQLGQALYAVVEKGYWIVANFKETQLEDMHVGQSVDIEVDALGGNHFKGRVDSISPSTGAQFALLPPDNSTGNFTKVVQRVPVKITFDPESIRGSEMALRPGLSTTVRVMTR
jgi:membrane fusion protein (multidrug efflux system)